MITSPSLDSKLLENIDNIIHRLQAPVPIFACTVLLSGTVQASLAIMNCLAREVYPQGGLGRAETCWKNSKNLTYNKEVASQCSFFQKKVAHPSPPCPKWWPASVTLALTPRSPLISICET